MKEHDAIIVSRYKAGESAIAIAETLGIAKRTVYNALDRAGVERTRVLISLTKEQEALVIQRYRDGESVFAMAKDFPVHLQTLHNVLKRNGVPVNPAFARKDLDEEQRKTVIEMCREGRTVSSVAKEFAVGGTQISHILRDYRATGGVLAMPQGRPYTCTVDHLAFDTLSPESEYWAGMLWADGCIHKEKSGAPRVFLALAARDRLQVENFRTFLKSDYAISPVPPTKTCLGGPGVFFAARSTHLCETLQSYGFVKKRARVPAQQLVESPAFWRGAVDGDGWLGNYEQNGATVGLSGQITLLESYRHFLAQQGLGHPNITTTESGIWKIVVAGNKAIDILNCLYKNATSTTSLERKNFRAQAILSGETRKFPSYFEEGPGRMKVKQRYLVELALAA